jgi:hypothetical protein
MVPAGYYHVCSLEENVAVTYNLRTEVSAVVGD